MCIFCFGGEFREEQESKCAQFLISYLSCKTRQVKLSMVRHLWNLPRQYNFLATDEVRPLRNRVALVVSTLFVVGLTSYDTNGVGRLETLLLVGRGDLELI